MSFLFFLSYYIYIYIYIYINSSCRISLFFTTGGRYNSRKLMISRRFVSLPTYIKFLMRSWFYVKYCLPLAKFNFPAGTANKTYLNSFVKGFSI